MDKFFLPLMNDNIDREDINSVIDFLSQDKIPKLTNGPKVVEFENAWGEWLGTKYNLFVNSGASANELTMLGFQIFLQSFLLDIN
jgi:CDP-6-deoxy-D-xylo-4-hexulose-3-dehydrase